MSIPDPVSTGLTVASTLQIAKQAHDFIAAVAGHPGESIGTMLGNIGRRRFANIESVGANANLILLNIGVKAGEVPLNVLQPMLEGASLQEDPTLQDTYAKLLANAADARQQKPVLPMFPGILKEFSSREVKFLDALYNLATKRASMHLLLHTVPQMPFATKDLMELFVELGFSHTRLLYGMTVEEQESPQLALDKTTFWLMLDIIRSTDVIRDVIYQPQTPGNQAQPDIVREYHISDLGAAFLKACQTPVGDAS